MFQSDLEVGRASVLFNVNSRLILVVVVVSENKQKSPFSYLVGSYFKTNWSPQNQNNTGRRTGRSSRRTPRTSLGKSSSPSGSGPCLYLDPGATGPSRRGSGQRVRGWPMGWPGGLGGAWRLDSGWPVLLQRAGMGETNPKVLAEKTRMDHFVFLCP